MATYNEYKEAFLKRTGLTEWKSSNPDPFMASMEECGNETNIAITDAFYMSREYKQYRDECEEKERKAWLSVEMRQRAFEMDSQVYATCGTDGFHDNHHNTHTKLQIEFKGNVVMQGDDGVLNINMEGNSELMTLIHAFEFVAKTLREQSGYTTTWEEHEAVLDAMCGDRFEDCHEGTATD